MHSITLVQAVAALLFAQHIYLSNSTLVAVYSLQRHGARNVLPKSSLLKESSLVGGPTLLPRGQFQTFSAGDAFRRRYVNRTTCGTTCLPGSGTGSGTKYGVANQTDVGFGNFNVYVRSSAMDRAILSGLCFFSGIFPALDVPTNNSYIPTGAQLVPIYTQADQDDILVRAYTKCPTYQAALTAWFAGPEFATKAAETAALRSQVAAMMPGVDTSLENWWNVYDSINVFQTHGVGDRVPFFNSSIFNEIQKVAYWLETAKMRSNLTGSLLGGVALGDLLAYLQAAAAAARNASMNYYQLLSLSGHYNTQLGLLAALRLDVYPGSQNFMWFWSIPKLAAVMVFELHSVASTAPGVEPAFFVRLVAQDGYDANYTTVPLPCGSAEAAAAVGPGACTLAGFVAYASPFALASSQAWCAACNNDGVTACALAQAQAAAQTGSGSGSGCDAEAWQIAVSVVVTFFGTLLLGAFGVWLWQRRRSPGSDDRYYAGNQAGAIGGAAGPQPVGSKGGMQAELVGSQFSYGMDNKI